MRAAAGAFVHIPAGAVHGFRIDSASARYLILTTPRHADFYRAITAPSRGTAITGDVIGKACQEIRVSSLSVHCLDRDDQRREAAAKKSAYRRHFATIVALDHRMTRPTPKWWPVVAIAILAAIYGLWFVIDAWPPRSESLLRYSAVAFAAGLLLVAAEYLGHRLAEHDKVTDPLTQRAGRLIALLILGAALFAILIGLTRLM